LSHKLLACTELGTGLLSCLRMWERGYGTGPGKGMGCWTGRVGRQKNEVGDLRGVRRELWDVVMFTPMML